MDRCTMCQFYDRQARGAERASGTGQCRRSAPALSPLNQKSYMIEGVWPTVRDDDWCGEWKALVRRIEPARISEALGASLASSLSATIARPVSMPPPRPPADDPLGSLLPAFTATARGGG